MTTADLDKDVVLSEHCYMSDFSLETHDRIVECVNPPMRDQVKELTRDKFNKPRILRRDLLVIMDNI